MKCLSRHICRRGEYLPDTKFLTMRRLPFVSVGGCFVRLELSLYDMMAMVILVVGVVGRASVDAGIFCW